MKHNATVEGSIGARVSFRRSCTCEIPADRNDVENRCVSYNKICQINQPLMPTFDHIHIDLLNINRSTFTTGAPISNPHTYVQERSHNNATEHSHEQPKAQWYGPAMANELQEQQSKLQLKNDPPKQPNPPQNDPAPRIEKIQQNTKKAFSESNVSLSEIKAHENKVTVAESYNRISMGATYTARRSNSTLGMKKQKMFLPPCEGTLPRETLSRRESCAIEAQRSIPGEHRLASALR